MSEELNENIKSGRKKERKQARVQRKRRLEVIKTEWKKDRNVRERGMKE